MVALIRTPLFSAHALRQHWREVLTLLVWIVVVAVIARSFIGSSTSPYGVCYGESGRSIPCELATPRQ